MGRTALCRLWMRPEGCEPKLAHGRSHRDAVPNGETIYGNAEAFSAGPARAIRAATIWQAVVTNSNNLDRAQLAIPIRERRSPSGAPKISSDEEQFLAAGYLLAGMRLADHEAAITHPRAVLEKEERAMQKLALNVSFLRQRAMQCRYLADSMKDQQIGEKLRKIANDYDCMAVNLAAPNNATLTSFDAPAIGVTAHRRCTLHSATVRRWWRPAR